MTRLLLASIGFAVLQLGAPHDASASGLRPGGESTRVGPRFEVVSKGALARDEVRADDGRLTGDASFVPVPAALPHLLPSFGQLPAQRVARSGPASATALLPRPRGPPA
ncbi:MAG: hypothetical protein PVI57_08905 [Gemmatimonadota bacterium]|jgi:hypothetical protein